jgi:Predicted Fe-S oxidoreductases
MKDKKKIVIYGWGRYPKDFLYVFDSIQVSYYVDDEEKEKVKCYKDLKNEKDSVFVIICKYDEKNARENLEKIGLKKGKDYVSAADLFPKLDFPIKDIAREKDVYIYGTGDISHYFFHDFVEKNPDVEIVGCVDSNPEKKGKTFFRRPIYMPEEVLDDDNKFFIVASTLYYQEIKKKLMEYGKKEGKDFISSLAINQWASWMMRETIYDIPRLDYVCPKPFQDAALMREGRLSVCVGVPSVENWNVPLFYSDFGQAWHSNIMKILRLSIINGTYSFCNEKKCELKRDCGRRIIDTDEMHYFTSRSKEQMALIAQKDVLPRDYIFHDSNYNIRENEYPDVVMFSYDRTCNLHCPSCRQEKYVADSREREILKDFTERMVTEVLPYVDRIKVAGDGEAFASSIYKNIIFNKKTFGKIPRIGILSNGTLLTPSTFDKIAENYESISVFISMDGCTKETAEKLRAGADFAKWKRNMLYLGQKREEGKIDFLAFNFVVQRANYLEMPEYVRMCLGFNADGIKFSQIRNMRYSEEEFEKMDMFDQNGQMKPELAEVVKDKIFERPEVHLFSWIDW